MNNRAYALDVLRALAIVGMVFSGFIARDPGLPAWLFHAQVPPPAFAFDPSVPGITWVDLVFPFFLFSMGAAFPLSLGRRLDKGTTPTALAGSILKRGVLLAFFAIVLGNTNRWLLDGALQSPLASALLTLVVWCAFFAMFIRLPRLSARQNGWLNLGGIAVLLGMVGLYAWLGVDVSLRRSDIIILILANVVVAGSFIWWLTRRNLWLRMGIVALVAALKIGAAVPGSWNEWLWNASFAPWLFRTDFLQYLCIVLPGSVAGDLIVRWLARRSPDGVQERPGRVYTATTVVALLFVTNMVCLYLRCMTVNLVLTAVLGGVAWLLLRKPRSADEKLLYGLFSTGLFWLLLGLALESFEGGIKKDPATLSYLFVTAGMASHVLLIATVVLDYARLKAGLLVRCGQNPMIAYTATGFVILPLLSLVDRVVPLPWLWGDCGHAMGVGRSVVVTLVMLLFTALFSRRKLFWRT